MSGTVQVGLTMDVPQTSVPASVFDTLPELGRSACAAIARSSRRLGVAPESEIALVLSGDEALHELNRRYRNRDTPTDVLTFPAPAPGPGLRLESRTELGDIIVSVPYAVRTAAAGNQGLGDELCLLAVHGLLHLLGHEDAVDESAALMRRLEVLLGVRPRR